MDIKFNSLGQFQITADVYDLIWLHEMAKETGQTKLFQDCDEAIKIARQESELVSDILQKEGWGE